MKIGIWELVVIFIVALIVIGPDKLPEYGRKFGRAMKEFKKATNEMTKEIRENVTEPLEEAQRPLKEALEPINDLQKELNQTLKDTESALKGKPVSPAAAPARSDAASPHEAAPLTAAPDKQASSEEIPPDRMSSVEGNETRNGNDSPDSAASSGSVQAPVPDGH